MPKKSEKGLLALFEHQEDLLNALRKMKGKVKMETVEAFSPFPVHGIDELMEIRRSWIPWATLVVALIGLTLGFAFQTWTSAYDWPINIGGKPLVSWPAFIPITFEVMILLSGVATALILIVGFIIPNFKKKVFHPRLLDDRFGLFIRKSDSQVHFSELQTLLKDCDAKEIREIE